MPDKSALGISEELHHFIAGLVENVILEDGNFENHKKYLRRFCQTEGIDYIQFETDLNDLFETAEELKSHESRGSERLLKLLAKGCYLYPDEIDKIISAINTKRLEEETKRRAEEAARIKREAEERERKVKKEAEKERRAREATERKAVNRAREESERKAKEETEYKEKMEKAEKLFQQWVNYYPPGTSCDSKMLEKKIPILKESAALGYSKAQNHLSQAFFFGLGVKRNYKESFRLAMASALQDNRGGQFLLGLKYLYGDVVEPNDELAFSWLSKSAQAGNPDGMIYLAICYRYGIGVTRDLDYANKLISQAKEIAPKRASYFSRIIDVVTDEQIKNARKSYSEIDN